MSHAKVLRRNKALRRWTVPLVALTVIIALGFLAYRAIVRFTADVRQAAMSASIQAALELFDSTFGTYPPSDANDVTRAAYGGAMKLAEAMMGQDLLGFHSGSAFRSDGLDLNGAVQLYPGQPGPDNLKARHERYSKPEYANIERLVDIYGKGNTGPFREDMLVICDVFEKDRPGGKKIGMPILYYRANTSVTLHDVNDPDNPENIYSYKDNQALISLGVPSDPDVVHPLADPRRFYMNTQNTQLNAMPRPYRPESYILISAGHDGLYGTADDICNFEWHYRK